VPAPYAQPPHSSATAATPGPWVQSQTRDAEPTIKRAVDAPPDHNRCGFGIVAVPSYGALDYGLANAEYIASWHPTVARDAARLFDAAEKVGPAHGGILWDAAVTLARTYLGDQS
jgi:hypothetical protein